MAMEIFEFSNKEKLKITKLFISKDWYKLTPWKHKGEDVKYVDYKFEFSDKTRVILETYYFGPFGLIKGKHIDSILMGRKNWDNSNE